MVLAREASQILGLYINGTDFGGIERETGCSLSTIRAFLSGFDDEVLNTLRSFKDLSEQFDDVPQVMDALEGAKLNGELERLGLDREDLESYLTFCDKAVNGSSSIIKEAVRFSELEEETGIPYDCLVEEQRNLKNEVDDLTQEADDLRERRSTLEQDVHDAESVLKNRLEEAELSLNRVDRVEELRSDLREFGMDLDDLEKVVDFYEACGEMGFDPKTVNQMMDLHSRMSKFGVDSRDISGFLRRNSKLNDLGFSIEAATVLADRLDEIGSDPEVAAEKLSEVFEESVLLDEQLRRLREKKENLRERTEAVESMVTSLEREAASVQEEVEDMDVRREQLIDREVQLRAKISEREQDLMEVENRVSELAESEDLIKDIQSLETRREELKTIIDDLERARDDTPDPDLDYLYIKMKDQRDELFQACVDLFRESTNAWVILAVEEPDHLQRLPTKSLVRLYKRIQVLKIQEEYGILSEDTLTEAEEILLTRLGERDPDIVDNIDEVEGFGELGELALI